jgi:hypothetical protein
MNEKDASCDMCRTAGGGEAPMGKGCIISIEVVSCVVMGGMIK